MKTKIVAPALAAVLLAVSSAAFTTAFARVPTQFEPNHNEAARGRFNGYQQCKAAVAKFDAYAAKHGDAQNLAKAEQLRNVSMQACQDHQFLRANTTLEQAMADIGMTSADVS